MSYSQNMFKILADNESDDESDHESDNQPDKNSKVSEEFLPLTVESVRNLTVQNQVCSEPEELEDPKVTDAKTRILYILKSCLKEKVLSGGFYRVFKTDSIFRLAKDNSIYPHIREIASGSDCDYSGYSFVVLQYKHFGTLLTIVASSYFGSCSHCDDDIALEDSLLDKNPKDILEILDRDLESKFHEIKFFTDFQEAIKFLKKINRYDTPIHFKTNPEKAAKRAQEKVVEKEQRDRFPSQRPPQNLTLGAFLPEFK